MIYLITSNLYQQFLRHGKSGAKDAFGGGAGKKEKVKNVGMSNEDGRSG